MAARLEVEGLTVELRAGGHRRLIVRDLTFAIPGGAIVALAGPSGSGKTLTALSLLGLLPPGVRAAGQARFRADSDGEPVNLLAAGERRLRRLRGEQIAWIPQETLAALDPRRTIAAQMREALPRACPRREARRQMEALLADLAIAEPNRCLASYPFQLSGGERQRVLIASALLPRPRLLLADEPTTALDGSAAAQVRALFRAAATFFDMAILLITHDLAVAAALADAIVVLHEGTLAEAGPAAQLLAKPASEYTRALLAASPVLGARAASEIAP
ncbi:MAG TPA: ATP-binding cassette domain-containing protein [Terriglobales bacterium]|nr:ATP-binding cassette domain-containing protein [Terriglobales bacterium]